MSEVPITVTLFGAAGRMGSEALQALLKESDIVVEHAVDIEERCGVIRDGMTVEPDSPDGDFAADVWVDVSLAEAATAHAKRADELGIPVLIGATGFDHEQQQMLDNLKVAHVIAPNLSPGVNTLFELIVRAAKALGPDYDVAITDVHHKHKVDRPSGTAKRMQARLGELGIEPETVSLRIGEVVGEHRVTFAAEGEVLELVHRASSRQAFARGIAPAVRFLNGKKSGSFTMADVLFSNP